MARTWQSAGLEIRNATTATDLVNGAVQALLTVLAPLFIGIALAAVLANLAQTGPVFSAKPLTPDFSRVNPAQGFKRLFSLRLLFESGKSVLKLLLMGAALALTVTYLLPAAPAFSQVHGAAYLRLLTDLTGSLMSRMLGVLLLIALVDLLFVRREFARRMRMSRRELKDEFKQREGDPRIRQRIRELRLEMLKRSRSLRRVSEADVLVTNPTHVAVALQYRHGTSPAPQVIAKGTGGLAHKMRDLAFTHRVPVVQSPPLARALYQEVENDGFVPEHWYPQVAKILVWVMAARQSAPASGGRP
jgi:flagellar biosynthesis protein FlhB